MRFNGSVMLGAVLSVIIYIIFGIVLSLNDSSGHAIIVIGALSIALVLSFLVKNDKPEQFKEEDKDDSRIENFYKISHNLMFGSKKLNVKLEHALYSVKKLLDCEAVSVGIYKDRKISILGQNAVIRDLIVNENIIPENIKKEFPLEKFATIEEFIVNFFKTDSDKRFSQVSFNRVPYQILILPLQTSNSLHPFGFFCAVFNANSKLTDEMQNEVSFFTDSLSFITNIEYRKDVVMQTHEKFYKQNSETDEQLGIFNRNKIDKTIKVESERYRRYLIPLSIVAFEIDDFKNFTNLMTNNEVINLKKDFANLINHNIRSTDVFGILKDDIFCIIASNVDYQGAHILVAKLMKIISEHSFPRLHNLSCCYGITSYSAKDAPALFVDRACEALKKAQEQGNNKFEIQLLV